jgi:hypothetical protein
MSFTQTDITDVRPKRGGLIGKCDIVVKFVNVNKQLETVKRSATYSY